MQLRKFGRDHAKEMPICIVVQRQCYVNEQHFTLEESKYRVLNIAESQHFLSLQVLLQSHLRCVRRVRLLYNSKALVLH